MRWLLTILLTLAICSCRSVRYVPVETVRSDTLYLNKVQRDSIRLVDSIYVREAGDTVTVEKYRYLYRDRLVHDTLYVTRTDSVQVPYPVEKSLTKWQQFKMRVGGWAVGLVALSALCIAFWLLWRKR